MDDKGSTLLAVFGLPPLSHEDDATRGVLAALSIWCAFSRLCLPAITKAMFGCVCWAALDCGIKV
jgi:hypothetical protein